MTQKQIRVGIVGADTNTSWAKVSHIPAIRGLPCLKLAALGRLNPAVRRAAQILASGRIGEPLNAMGVSTTSAYGPHLRRGRGDGARTTQTPPVRDSIHGER